MTTVMTVHVFKTRYMQKNMTNDSQEHELLDQVYKKWRVDTCVIGSKLHAYFPDTRKGDEQIHKNGIVFRFYLPITSKTVEIRTA